MAASTPAAARPPASSLAVAFAVFVLALEGDRRRRRLPAVHPAAAGVGRRPVRRRPGPTGRSRRTRWTTLVEVAARASPSAPVAGARRRLRARPLARSPSGSLSPYLVAAQATPILALAPLLALWFGPGLDGQGRDLRADRVLPGRDRDDGRHPLGRRAACSSWPAASARRAARSSRRSRSRPRCRRSSAGCGSA